LFPATASSPYFVRTTFETSQLPPTRHHATRLATSKNDEEKGDIISKLAMWPGMTMFSPTTRREVLAKAGMALAHLDKVQKNEVRVDYSTTDQDYSAL
jgi:hypothetical protein